MKAHTGVTTMFTNHNPHSPLPTPYSPFPYVTKSGPSRRLYYQYRLMRQQGVKSGGAECLTPKMASVVCRLTTLDVA